MNHYYSPGPPPPGKIELSYNIPGGNERTSAGVIRADFTEAELANFRGQLASAAIPDLVRQFEAEFKSELAAVRPPLGGDPALVRTAIEQLREQFQARIREFRRLQHLAYVQLEQAQTDMLKELNSRLPVPEETYDRRGFLERLYPVESARPDFVKNMLGG